MVSSVVCEPCQAAHSARLLGVQFLDVRFTKKFEVMNNLLFLACTLKSSLKRCIF
jgi:hypothetical protein